MKRITLLFALGAVMFGPVASAQHGAGGRHHGRRAVERMEAGMAPCRECGRCGMRHDRNTPCPKEGMVEKVKVLSATSTRIGEMVELDFFINYDQVYVNSNEQFVITPFLAKEGEMLVLPPVIFTGERALRQAERGKATYINGFNDGLDPYEIVLLTAREQRARLRAQRNGAVDWTADSPFMLHYRASFPYQMWMDGAEIMLDHTLINPRGTVYKYASGVGTLYNPMPPQVMFIVPEVEVVKARSESMTARLVFKVGKTVIDRNIFDNEAELANIYKFTENILTNPDLKITSIKMTGYASPEGGYQLNADLSRGRVNALKELLAQKYPKIDRNLYRIDNVPEDWDSVRRWVIKSDLPTRSQVIDIIDNYGPDERDAKIRALDRGVTYNRLLKEVYPGLRRVEYTINYTVMPFTVEKGKQVMKTNPQYLSLNELYQIALTYPIDSQEYAAVFETAVRYFPNDPVANNNMAAIALRRNDPVTARRYLERVGDFAGAYNNLGVLNALEGNYDEAEKYFRKAAAAGSREAEYNIMNLQSLRQ